MIINYLELQDFRQFTGCQRIDFSTDPDKKVTIIEAESGAGKTTLLQSFQWIFYGETKYKSIINNNIKQKMHESNVGIISGKISLEHDMMEYIIERSQKITKLNGKINEFDSILLLDVKSKDGTTKQLRGRDAELSIKRLLHKDLYEYFFLEGESLTKVGEEMSRGKSGKNSEFLKAIKGLLGFNYLFEALTHLKAVEKDYEKHIRDNTHDVRLRQILSDIEKHNEEIRKCDNIIKSLDDKIIYYRGQKEKLNAEILLHGEAETNQRRSKQIGNELLSLEEKINSHKKYIFKKFSSAGIYAVMNALLPVAQDTLIESKGIELDKPGMNMELVKSILAEQKCICGKEFCEDSEEYGIFIDWEKNLPPNNIGYEIKQFKAEINRVKKNADDFEADFKKAREVYAGFIFEYDRLQEELEEINEKISEVHVDVSNLKQQERDNDDKYTECLKEKGAQEKTKTDYLLKLEKLEQEKSKHEINDKKIMMVQTYCDEAKYLHDKIERFLKREEEKKQKSLSSAINEIFKDFYEEKIQFELEKNYALQIRMLDNDLSEDFTSGGQDVAVALAFIGGIMRVKLEPAQDADDMIDVASKEIYPLVMDAPTSKFGMKQMDSFSKMMPSITDQIIVFINDKDGPILQEKMRDKIGKKWRIKKEDTYHAVIQEVIKYGN